MQVVAPTPYRTPLPGPTGKVIHQYIVHLTHRSIAHQNKGVNGFESFYVNFLPVAM